MDRKKYEADLRSILEGLTGNASIADTAMARLAHAAENYLLSAPEVDDSQRRSRPSLAEGRVGLAKLEKHLSAVLETSRNLPLEATAALANATEHPIGKFVHEVQRLTESVKASQAILNAKPCKEPDHHAVQVALEVGLVFRDVLGKKPSSTRDIDPNVTGKKNGAAYARVLRATFTLAGKFGISIGPIMDRGLVLLRDKELPHNHSRSARP